MIRKPQATGFYPGSREEIIALLGKIIDSAMAKEWKWYTHGIAPHAGHIYSGLAAAALYKYLKPARKVVILGNDHYGNAMEISAHPYDEWETPLGRVPVAKELGEKLGLPEVESPREHSIEVQLPFLQYLRGEFEFFPVTVPQVPLSELEKFGEKLRKLGVQVVATTDLSHYVPKPVAVEKDALAVDSILRGDPVELLHTVEQHRISMCGLPPVMALLYATEGLEKELLMYYTSGDIAGGEDSVVGYASIGIAPINK